MESRAFFFRGSIDPLPPQKSKTHQAMSVFNKHLRDLFNKFVAYWDSACRHYNR